MWFFRVLGHSLHHNLTRTTSLNNAMDEPLSEYSIWSQINSYQTNLRKQFKRTQSSQITWQIQHGSTPVGGSSNDIKAYFHCFMLLIIFSSVTPVFTYPMRSPSASNSWETENWSSQTQIQSHHVWCHRNHSFKTQIQYQLYTSYYKQKFSSEHEVKAV